MKYEILIPLTLLAAFGYASAQAFDTAVGKQLVDKNCYACHGNELYTRENPMVTSRNGLTKQVQRCELSLGLSWFDEDVDNAAEYLDQQFYHLGKK